MDPKGVAYSMTGLEILVDAALRKEAGDTLLGLAEPAPKKSKRKSSKRTSPLKPYEVAMLLSACGGGHVNPKDAVDEARGYLVGMRCPSGMEKTKTGGCRQKRNTKSRKTKKQKPTLKERETECKKKEGKQWTGKRCIKMRKERRKTKRAPSVYNLFVQEVMPQIEDLSSKEKMKKVGDLWRQPEVKKQFYADKGVPMPSRRKTKKQKPTLEERKTACKKRGKVLNDVTLRCYTPKPTPKPRKTKKQKPTLEERKTACKKRGKVLNDVTLRCYTPKPTLEERKTACEKKDKHWTGTRCIKKRKPEKTAAEDADEDDALQEKFWQEQDVYEDDYYDDDVNYDYLLEEDGYDDFERDLEYNGYSFYDDDGSSF